MLVIAHPDDESMFFAPTLLSMREAQTPMYVLCLSNGKVLVETHFLLGVGQP